MVLETIQQVDSKRQRGVLNCIKMTDRCATPRIAPNITAVDNSPQYGFRERQRATTHTEYTVGCDGEKKDDGRCLKF